MIDIAKVLTMSEDEQYGWICARLSDNRDYKTICHLSSNRISLADLAFHLRDEAVGENKERWLKACFEVDNIAGNYNDGRIYTRNNGYTAEYNVLKRGPIF